MGRKAKGSEAPANEEDLEIQDVDPKTKEEEQVDEAKMEKALKILEHGPDEIKKMQKMVAEAGAYVGKFSPKERQATLAECMVTFQEGVKRDICARHGVVHNYEEEASEE